MAGPQSIRKKLLIDCDPGIDDALALILAFHSPELEVLGVSGVNGNVSLAKVMKNIKKILSLLKPSHRPLLSGGAEKPLQGDWICAEFFHGKDGLGGARIRTRPGEIWWKKAPGKAAEFIPRMARKHPGEITLVAIGPPTNLGLALRRDPEGMAQLKEIVLMGGAIREEGNITPYAEFNFFVDPLAAQTVLQSRIPVTLVPLDATHQVPLLPDAMEILRCSAGPFSRFVLQATGYDSHKKRFHQGRPYFFLHDPLAVGAVIHPDLLKKEKMAVSVETSEGKHHGQCRVLPEGEADQKINVGLGVDSQKFLDLFLSRLEA